MHKIAAVVIIYNPEPDVIRNVNSYINQVDMLYIIDNSEKNDSPVVEKMKCLSKADYIWNKCNLGIAAALNIGVKKAIEDGFEYILTMDQDSEANSSLVSTLLECFTLDSKIAIVAPILRHPNQSNVNLNNNELCTQEFTVWTSGSLIDLKVFAETEGFREDFFIDYVDHEFCLRITELGYKIYRCNKTTLIHRLGKIEKINLLFRKVHPTNHSALRLYYRARNRFYVKKVYKNIFPGFFKEDNKEFWKNILKVILFEKGKFKKIKFFIIGYIHFRKNKFGKYS